MSVKKIIKLTPTVVKRPQIILIMYFEFKRVAAPTTPELVEFADCFLT
jgi:hypothetical protein